MGDGPKQHDACHQPGQRHPGATKLTGPCTCQQTIQRQRHDEEDRRQRTRGAVERRILFRERQGKDRGQHQQRNGEQQEQVQPVTAAQVTHEEQETTDQEQRGGDHIQRRAVRHRMDPDLAVVPIQHPQRVPCIREENLAGRAGQRTLCVTQAGEGALEESGRVFESITQHRQEDQQREQCQHGQPQHRLLPIPLRLAVQQIQPDRDHGHERYNAERTITVQPQAEEEAGEDEIVALRGAQAAQEVVKRRRDEKGIEREAQPGAADDVRPVGNARKEHRQQADALVGNLLAQKIHIGERRQACQNSANLQAEERQACAEDGSHGDGQVHLEALATSIAREENVRLALGDFVYIQDLFSVVAEWFRGDLTKLINAEKNRNSSHSQHDQRPARELDLPGFLPQEAPQTFPERFGSWFALPQRPDQQDQRQRPHCHVEGCEQVVAEGQKSRDCQRN